MVIPEMMHNKLDIYFFISTIFNQFKSWPDSFIDRRNWHTCRKTVLLIEETGVPVENHQRATSH